jgi:hypothetical protein
LNPTGVLTGGWEYVIAAYVVSLVILVSYTASVVLRYRAEVRRAQRANRAAEVP